MTSTISAGLFAAFFGVATVGMTAQTPQPPQTAPPPAAQSAQPPAAQPSTPPAPGDITLTGCLKEAPASAADAATPVGTTGTAGATATAGASAPGPQYILSDATPSPASSPETSAQASPAGASASAAPQTYRLIANASALTPHVGKKLELVGTLESNASEAQSSAAGASAPALRVKSGKIVAASCTP